MQEQETRNGEHFCQVDDCADFVILSKIDDDEWYEDYEKLNPKEA